MNGYSYIHEVFEHYHKMQEENIIAVMGVTGAGKSTFVKDMSRDSKIKIGCNLLPCTQKVNSVTFMLGNTRTTLIDTPGFNDTTMTDQEVYKTIVEWMSQTYKQGIKLKGIIYMHKITDNRMAGSALKYMNMFKELCGEDCVSNVILVTTMWDSVVHDIGVRRESELCNIFWKIMIINGSIAKRYHKGDTTSGREIIQHLISKNTTVFKVQHEIVDMGMNIYNTSSVKCLDSAEISELKIDMEKFILQDARSMRLHEKYNRSLREKLRLEFEVRNIDIDITYKKEAVKNKINSIRINNNSISSIYQLINDTQNSRTAGMAAATGVGVGLAFFTFGLSLAIPAIAGTATAASDTNDNRRAAISSLTRENSMLSSSMAAINREISYLETSREKLVRQLKLLDI